jgi:hypothetical protein
MTYGSLASATEETLPMMKRVLLMTVTILAACGGDDDGGQASASLTTTATTMSTSDGGDETGPCDPGSPGCSCANGMCLDPLVCVDDVCVWPPPPPTTDDGGTDTSGGDTTGDETGPPTCSQSNDCDWFDVCGVDGTCVDALDAAYEIRVPNWRPNTCDGGPLDGDADLYWRLDLDGVEIGRSGWVQGGCPGSWTDVMCVAEGEFAENFYLSTRDDDDGTDDDLMDALWWDYDVNSAPDPIDPYYLHEGVIDTDTGSGGHVRVEFTVVDGCG